MAIIPFNELDKYITTTAFEIGHESLNMLESFRSDQTSRERVVENVTRLLYDAMNTIEESESYGATAKQNYLPEE